MPLTRDSHFAGYDPATLRLAIERQNLDTPMARILHRHYDSLGRPLSLDLTTNASPAVTEYTTGYAYDNGGRMQNVWHHPALDATTKAPTGSPTFTYGYTYNQPTAADPRTGAASGSNLKEGFMPYTVTRNAAGANPALTANRTYEATRDALHTIENKAGINVVSSYTYGVNSITQRESVTTAGTAFTSLPADWAWHYDSLGQVIHADHANINTVDRRYEYDTIGNRTKTAIGTASLPTNPNWVSNALNQYTTVNGTVQPTTPAPAPFDADGNMTAGPIPGVNGNNHGVQSPGSATAIKWDAENRLISMRIGTPVFSYTYDHHSRLITRATNGTVNTRYSYDGWNRIAQYNNTTLQDTFTWGLDLSGTMQGAGGVGGLLATRWVSSSNTDYFPTYDGNGNVSEYLTTTGTTTVHYEYDPFGTITRRTGSTSTRFVYRFSTKPRDINSGLYYYGYRWYDPYTGRWPSRDPIEESGGINLYGFVGNDGINKWDLLGKQFYSPGAFNTRDTYEPITGQCPTPEQIEDAEIAAAVAVGGVFVASGALVLVTETAALQLATARIAQLTRCIKCLRCKKPQIGRPNHAFYLPKRINKPPYVVIRRCYMKHVEIKCWIDGKKGSTMSIQIPFGPCYKHLHAQGGITH